MRLFLWGKYPEVKWLDHVTDVHVSLYIFRGSIQSLPTSPHPYLRTLVIFSVLVLILMIVIPMNVRSHCGFLYLHFLNAHSLFFMFQRTQQVRAFPATPTHHERLPVCLLPGAHCTLPSLVNQGRMQPERAFLSGSTL